MARKLFIQTHGCQMNEYDSTRMVDLLEGSHGLTRTDNPEDADVLLLNTCSIREKAQEKVFHQLGRWKQLKQNKPDLIIGVGGCVASQEGEAIRERAPYVDVVFGPQTLHRLPGLITQAANTRELAIDVSFPEIEKNSTTCLNPASTAPPPLFPSWKVAPNTAPSVLFLTPAAKKSAVRCNRYWLKLSISLKWVCARLICSGRMLMPIAAKAPMVKSWI